MVQPGDLHLHCTEVAGQILLHVWRIGLQRSPLFYLFPQDLLVDLAHDGEG